MSYQINKTDGSLLVDLVDGQIDSNSTNLVLVGRNYTGYGEIFNENFVRLLENFSNSAAPSNPLKGQTWWDTANQRLKVYNGLVWIASGSPFVQPTIPLMVTGDLWIDNLNNQLYAFDGVDVILIGPQYTKSQGESGFRTGTLLDESSRSRTVSYLYIGGTLVGLLSSLDFTPVTGQKIAGLITQENPTGRIYEGFNVINQATFKFRGIAEAAESLVSSDGRIRPVDSFLPSDTDGITSGTITIQNAGGLTIGMIRNTTQKIVGGKFYIENQIFDQDMSLRVASSLTSSTIDAVYIDASTARVGIFNNNPQYALDVTGDLRISGNLLFSGTANSLDINILRVEDKVIQLARTVPGSELSAADANDTGIIFDIAGSLTKKWTWESVTNAWTSNVGINISDSSTGYHIGGELKLTNTSLVNIQKALDLNEIGTLISLSVDNTSIDGTTIKAGAAIAASDPTDNLLPLNIIGTAGINISSLNGNIALTTPARITGVLDPTQPQDAATKLYTDTAARTEPVGFSLDVTGLGTGTALADAVAVILLDLYQPYASKVAMIHTVSYSNSVVSGVDIASATTITSTLVDKNGTENESVVKDIAFDPAGAAGTVSLTPSRALMEYAADGTNWNLIVVTNPY